MRSILITLRVFFILMLIFGVCYPVVITSISQYVMPKSANGSLIEKNGVVVGSKLIGQEFISPEYFHSRPDVGRTKDVDVTGSNLSPSSDKLMATVVARADRIRAMYGFENSKSIIADMLLVSASGLDPHISLNNALLQAPRIAKHRNVSLEKIKRLIARCTDKDFVGIWGNSGVNVLQLNLLLDK